MGPTTGRFSGPFTKTLLRQYQLAVLFALDKEAARSVCSVEHGGVNLLIRIEVEPTSR